MSRTTRIAFCSLITLTIAGGEASADSSPLITSAHQQKEHRRSDPAEPWTFAIEARVGFASRRNLYLQQSGEPWHVEVPARLSHISSELQLGSLVRVSGISTPDDTDIVSSIEVLEPSGELAPANAAIWTTEPRTLRHSYSFVKGRVMQIVRRRGKTLMCVKVNGNEVAVEISKPVRRNECLNWIERRVRVEGVYRLPDESVPLLMVQSLKQITLCDEPGQNARDAPEIEMLHLKDACVLASSGRRLVLEHREFERPLVIWSRYSDHLAFRDLVSLDLQSLVVPDVADASHPPFRARYIELTGAVDGVNVLTASSLSEIAPPKPWQRGLIELTGTLEVNQHSKLTIKTTDGQFLATGVGLDSLGSDRPAEGAQVRIAGVPLWSGHQSDTESGHRTKPKLTLMIPTKNHLQTDSVPLRISKNRVVGAASLVALILLSGVIWNRSLRHQVNLRTQQLSDANSHLTTSFEAVREAIILSDKTDTVVRTNSNFERFFGFRPEPGSSLSHCLNRLAYLFDDSNSFEKFCGYEQDAEAKREIELLMDSRNIQVFRNSVRDQQGRTAGYLWAFYDCTDQRQLEHELFQAQKMEAIGQLSGGLAHDLNNLLTVISGNTEVLRMRAEHAGVESKEFADPVDIAISRAAGLTRQMLDFARNSRLNLRPVDINSLVEEVYHLARGTIDANIDLSLSMHPDPLVVKADSGRIVQVLLNLCINARDAIEDECGTIRIRTRQSESEASEPLACIEVADDGEGMTESVRQRVFDPFFTTKKRQAGTGLGLSTAFGIVKQLGGNIECESVVSEGTTFRVFLPVITSDEPLDSETARPRPRNQRPPGLRVLLVDDEAMLRTAGTAVLETLDHDVTTAVDGRDAIEIIERSPAFDAVLLDLTMPQMNGHEACEIIRERWPELPVIICSGYSTTHLDDSLTGVTFLSKPFRLKELEGALNEVLPATI